MTPHPTTKRSYPGIGVLAGCLYLLPLIGFLAAGRSPFMTFWEFGCYRYYGALSMLNHDFPNIWVVQGFPMAIVQSWVMRFFLAYSPAALGSVAQIDTFASVTVGIAYLVCALALGTLWFFRRLSLSNKIILTVATLLMWPLSRYYVYLYTPDYWTLEIPMYVVSVTWLFFVLEHGENNPGPLRISWLFPFVSGFWLAFCFLQKPSLLAFAALPAVAIFARAQESFLLKVVKAVLLVAMAGFSHWLLFLAFYLFHQAAAWPAYLHYLDWLMHHAETGTSLASSFGELVRWANYMFVPVVIGAIFLAWAGVMIVVSPDYRRGRGLIILFLLLAALGHVGVILKRPTGTSVVDTMFFGTFVIPVLFALSPAAQLKRLGRAYAVAVIIGLFFWQPRLWKIWPHQNDRQTIARIEELRRETKSAGRPIALLVPDNRIHPHTAEAFGLYTGQLNHTANQYGPDGLPLPFPATSLRQQLFPGTFIFNRGEDQQLHAAIEAGYMVIWGEAANAPKIGEFFPEVDRLVERPGLVQKVYDIIPEEAVKTHIAYLNPPPNARK
jgi:hypothetical protein